MVLCVPSKLPSKHVSRAWSFDRAEQRKQFVVFPIDFVSGNLVICIHCSLALSFTSPVIQTLR